MTDATYIFCLVMTIGSVLTEKNELIKRKRLVDLSEVEHGRKRIDMGNE